MDVVRCARHAGDVVPPNPVTPALERALQLVGDRWSLLVVAALAPGPLRYGEVAQAVPGIAPNILAARLRQLTRDGLVHTVPYSERPRRVTYELTTDGRSLADALATLEAWGARREGLPEPRYHATCGTAVELRPWCPTCEVVVDDGGVDDLDRA